MISSVTLEESSPCIATVIKPRSGLALSVAGIGEYELHIFMGNLLKTSYLEDCERWQNNIEKYLEGNAFR
jgi:hypothetical protein